MKVVFLAKGSRGDVEPLLAVCLALLETREDAQATLACCQSSLSGLEEMVDSCRRLTHHSIPESRQRLLDVKGEGPTVVDTLKSRLMLEEVESAILACQDADLVVFNLFTCEGYYIARSMNVPCVAASPFIITRPPPSGFERKFAAARPDLYRQLKDAQTAGVNQLSYTDVDHWMWRLFLSDLTSACCTAGLTGHIVLSSSSSSSPLPLPPPLLYGVSSTIFPRQPFWPSSVHLCGYWQLQQHQIPPLPSELLELVSSLSPPLLYIGFGSMEHYLESSEWLHTITVIDKVCGALSLSGLLQCHHGSHLHKAFLHHSSFSSSHLKLWCHPASHGRLFKLCSAVLHHGGSGTAAAALMAGTPQVICPVMFDQHHTAEQLQWRGVAKVCAGPAHIVPHQLTVAIQSTLSETMKRQVSTISEQLLGEHSLSSTTTVILSALNKCEQ